MTGRPPKITREQYRDLRTRAAMGVKHRILARETGSPGRASSASRGKG